ncbi:hypothetical protein HZU40_00455 (plasmid) [Mycolicibacterium fluoranthenivorans]|uniref:Bacterial transcriptional activator domain-containing protein n=1 Tax=Mycolicibacterium fluoranthenivorans TaxID=258505 RepID=A0A7G8P6J9_9MYCO|nr:hypothetical protein [Mycolicibacterium fluoranthenivorans]QNJ89965.1 hypothetical protein HZU40_00455 [Mycolicibacterium fluoranthenivorans]
MTSSTAVRSAPVTSWWYGQGRAVDVARRLESLYALSPAPAGPAGLITARPDELTVTFVAGLKSPLPHPWRPADSTNEARIPWDAVDPNVEPDPDHPVYLVVLGTTDDGALIGLNLAAFQRIRLDGDSATTTALVSRWVLELLATHPDITIGVTHDVWRGPLTSRVQAATVGRVPQVDVLVCGPDLTYTDRAQIVSNAASKIMIDLGRDAAVDTKWTISCSPDRLAQISNGVTRPMTATLILPSPATVERCSDLLTDLPPAPAEPAADEDPFDAAIEADEFDETDTDPQLLVLPPTAAALSDTAPPSPEGIDFFAPSQASAPGGDEEAQFPEPGYDDDSSAPIPDSVIPAAQAPAGPPIGGTTPRAVAGTVGALQNGATAEPGGGADRGVDSETAVDDSTPQIAPIWNRILGQVDLCPPNSTQQPGPREKRLNELTVFLQHNRFADSADIIRGVYGGAASDKTVTQQVSMLRARLGAVRAGGPKALPPMRDGAYGLDSAVRSDWMEFERLVEILIDSTPTANLVAAMNLVTGPPLGGVPTREWAWTKDLRDEICDRVAGSAVVLARRHHSAKKFSAAIDIARKGLWYDNARQDLWQIGMQAALDGHDKEMFKSLRSQYLSAVAGSDRDPAVLDLTKQAG